MPDDRGWITYITYPDAFFEGERDGHFLARLREQLPRIRGLGCDAVHVLPAFESPGMDMGFDVSDFLHVDPRLGSDGDMDALLQAARDLGLRVILDLILNHVSVRHPWFQRALDGGDRSFFLTTDVEPRLLAIEASPGKGEYAVYSLRGREFAQRIVFPNQCDRRLPHWRKVQPAGGPPWWYYHTFYPHQADLDWHHPGLPGEFARIVEHWASRGVSFRLDAVPFIGRDVLEGDVRKDTDGATDRTHGIVRALREVMRRVAPEPVFLVEASESPERVRRYLGPDEAQLAYDFHASLAMWAALATRDPSHLAQNLPGPVEGASVLVPVRTHDGILLDNADAGLAGAVVDGLLRPRLWPPDVAPAICGRASDAVCDIPGRTRSLLGGEPRRVLLAHFLAACLPGHPMLYYGDELGLRNDPAFMVAQRRRKEALTGQPAGLDFREINRGPVRREDLDTPDARTLSAGIAAIFAGRPGVCARERPDAAAGLPAGILGLSWSGGVRAYANLGARDRAFAVPADA